MTGILLDTIKQTNKQLYFDILHGTEESVDDLSFRSMSNNLDFYNFLFLGKTKTTWKTKTTNEIKNENY